MLQEGSTPHMASPGRASMPNVRALDCVCFTLIIDDIVLPDGRTCMQQLGGGGESWASLAVVAAHPACYSPSHSPRMHLSPKRMTCGQLRCWNQQHALRPMY